jgi:hypothetical protein
VPKPPSALALKATNWSLSSSLQNLLLNVLVHHAQLVIDQPPLHSSGVNFLLQLFDQVGFVHKFLFHEGLCVIKSLLPVASILNHLLVDLV